MILLNSISNFRHRFKYILWHRVSSKSRLHLIPSAHSSHCQSSIYMASITGKARDSQLTDINKFSFIPIGYLESCFKTKNGTPRQPSVCNFARGRLKILKSVFQRPDHSLEGLQEFSHVWVIYVFHQNNNKSFTKAKVKPPRLNGQKTGVFACRSPYRPNPIGLTLARLESIKGDTLHLSGIDMIDGTPVLDIKPFIPSYDITSENKSNILKDGFQEITEYDEPRNEICGNVCVAPPLTDLEEVKNGDDDSKYERGESRTITAQNEVKNSVRGAEIKKSTVVKDDNNRGDLSDQVTGNMGVLSCDLKSNTQISTALNDALINSVIDLKSELPIDTHGDAYLPKSCNFNNSSISRDNETSYNAEIVMKQNAKSEKREMDDLNNCDVNDQAVAITDYLHPKMHKENLADVDVTVGDWVNSPPIGHLNVRFTPSAETEIQRFGGSELHKASTDDKFTMEFFKDAGELREAIISILSADPRSTYRRTSCNDKLYFFPLDKVHITCWFCNDSVEVLRVQPLCDADIPNKN